MPAEHTFGHLSQPDLQQIEMSSGQTQAGWGKVNRSMLAEDGDMANLQSFEALNWIRVTCQDHVALVQLNRPDKLNALSPELMTELVWALETLDSDDTIRCMVLAGSDKAFAAGADIGPMAQASAETMVTQNPFALWDRIARLKKPLIAAVSGYALGGGCEVALMCDMIVASETAKFGQPEINIGVIPGAGGSQRLTRVVGKARAMELILTGRTFSAAEALAWGLVVRVFSAETWLTDALTLAQEIAHKPLAALISAKAAVNAALEMPLTAGLTYERAAFYQLFDTPDKHEGMSAFLEKRKPVFQGLSQ